MQQNRRNFLKGALVGGGYLLTAPGIPFVEASLNPAPRSATDRVILGKTGIEASFLAQGTGFRGSARSSAHTRMGKENLDRLLRHSLDQGISFLDMADLYGSHPNVKEVIKGLPRDRFVLLSKIWPREQDWVKPSGGASEEIDRFRKELGVDMIDICLIHCMLNDKWTEEYKGIRDGLSEMKEKGAIRATGVSCHDLGALKLAVEHPWVDVIFARVNNQGGREYSMDGTAQEIADTLKLARKNGKAVVGMKIFGAGKLTKPEQKDASLKFVTGNNLVDAMTIGMLSQHEVDDSIRRINKVLA